MSSTDAQLFDLTSESNRFEANRSIQLSYGRANSTNNLALSDSSISRRERLSGAHSVLVPSIEDRYIDYRGDKPIRSWHQWRLYAVTRQCEEELAKLPPPELRAPAPLEQKALWNKREDYGRKSTGR